MPCPIKVNTNTIEFLVHTSWYCVLDLLCVKIVQNLCLICFQYFLEGYCKYDGEYLEQFPSIDSSETCQKSCIVR